MMPKPPSACGRMTVCQATLARVSLRPSLPDQRKFRTILLSWATHECEKHQQEATSMPASDEWNQALGETTELA